MTIIRKDSLPPEEVASGYPDPFNLGRGHLLKQRLSNAGGLTQYGAYLETLLPGGQSSQVHWHEGEDEFLYLLEGELTVIEGDTETVIGPGDACAWKAGTPVGHTIRNDADRPALYLMVGSRADGDVCHYPGLDLRAEGERYVHLDGTPYTATDE